MAKSSAAAKLSVVGPVLIFAAPEPIVGLRRPRAEPSAALVHQPAAARKVSVRLARLPMK